MIAAPRPQVDPVSLSAPLRLAPTGRVDLSRRVSWTVGTEPPSGRGSCVGGPGENTSSRPRGRNHERHCSRPLTRSDTVKICMVRFHFPSKRPRRESPGPRHQQDAGTNRLERSHEHSAAARRRAIQAAPPGRATRREPAWTAWAEFLRTTLGWFSLGLGATEISAPRSLARTLGVHDSAANRSVRRLFGVREVAAGVGIFVSRRPERALWGRVAGDVLDLSALGLALSRYRFHPRSVTRLGVATGAVVGCTVLD